MSGTAVPPSGRDGAHTRDDAASFATTAAPASIYSTDSTATDQRPLIRPEDHHHEGHAGTDSHDGASRRKSLFDKLPWHKAKDGEHGPNKHDKAAAAASQRESIADSGPLIFVYNPALGKEVLTKNPHWPNEDSGKREEQTKGQWAFGSEMAGPQGPKGVDDFGGTVG